MLKRLVGLISERVWGSFSRSIHLATSWALAQIYETRLSRFFIQPYCWWQYGDRHYYKRFKPGRGRTDYHSFQDFFTREFKQEIAIRTSEAWPCEGLLCDLGQMGKLGPVSVKGETRHPRIIFGEAGDQIPDDYYFANVFLHNNNYHHIHSPVSGKVSRIEHIDGELLFLRPWAYPDRPSLPALCNERVNIDLIDDAGRPWYVSIIGGPLVATIELAEKMKLGARFIIGERLGGFLLGSTCCIAAPLSPSKPVNQRVAVGEPL